MEYGHVFFVEDHIVGDRILLTSFLPSFLFKSLFHYIFSNNRVAFLYINLNSNQIYLNRIFSFCDFLLTFNQWKDQLSEHRDRPFSALFQVSAAILSDALQLTVSSSFRRRQMRRKTQNQSLILVLFIQSPPLTCLLKLPSPQIFPPFQVLFPFLSASLKLFKPNLSCLKIQNLALFLVRNECERGENQRRKEGRQHRMAREFHLQMRQTTTSSAKGLCHLDHWSQRFREKHCCLCSKQSSV